MEPDGDSRRCEKGRAAAAGVLYVAEESVFAGDPCMTGSQAKDWIALHAREREE